MIAHQSDPERPWWLPDRRLAELDGRAPASPTRCYALVPRSNVLGSHPLPCPHRAIAYRDGRPWCGFHDPAAPRGRVLVIGPEPHRIDPWPLRAWTREDEEAARERVTAGEATHG